MLTYKNNSFKIELVKSGQLSLTENVRFFLNKIEKNKHLNAFNFVFADDALLKAEEIEGKIKSGKHGKLAGLVIAIKDVLAIKDKPLTCSSKILQNFNSVYNATIINKLIDEDAIIIGKTNCDEFAMGSSNENSFYGPVLNPIDNTRVPGGSSGGSAAAVAAYLCDASIGTDTGGSIRQPASFCGVYGLKPTYGRVSRYGLTAFASSFDSIGTFTNSIEDAAEIMEVISGYDKYDSTSVVEKVPSYKVNILNLKKNLVIGVPTQYFSTGLNEGVKNKILALIDNLKKDFTIKEISLPNMDYAIATYYILTTAEASSNLSRYDGVRYGHRSREYTNLDKMYKNSRSEGFGKEVKRRIMLGTYVLSAGYYDAYYKKAQKVRRLIKNDFDNAFNEVDLIITPVTPTTAFKLNEKSNDPLEMYLNDIYTTSINLAGIPAISLPLSTDLQGLPIGVQVIADSLKEDRLFQFGKFLQDKNLIKRIS
ncbi:MAG TPA: Asp-tRNA(Asn)/Glu-tRNA(Gln) amidotransferase subunit GatA [Ignavibacteriaceae bacterium]|nr:Asp-tRNA(Asn)/Glu-tRNA(Gln) amidotransferase subunit GatA [Ignavibacteriaceae bacterium]